MPCLSTLFWAEKYWINSFIILWNRTKLVIGPISNILAHHVSQNKQIRKPILGELVKSWKLLLIFVLTAFFVISWYSFNTNILSSSFCKQGNKTLSDGLEIYKAMIEDTMQSVKPELVEAMENYKVCPFMQILGHS